MFGNAINGDSPMDETRQQYRVALAKQLRVGLEENRQIDLRDSGHEVVVAFSDELISPVWHELAVKNARAVHLFVAPTEFETGQLTMVSLIEGSRELDIEDHFIDADITFEELVAELRSTSEFDPALHQTRRYNVVDVPDSVYHDGLAYSFKFAELIDV